MATRVGAGELPDGGARGEAEARGIRSVAEADDGDDLRPVALRSGCA